MSRPASTPTLRLAGTPARDPKLPPMPPSFLRMSGEDKRHWRKLAPRLHRHGLLTELDTIALSMLCHVLTNYDKAMEMHRATGGIQTGKRGGIRPHPCVSMLRMYRRQALAIASKFYMTPRARDRDGLVLEIDTTHRRTRSNA